MMADNEQFPKGWKPDALGKLLGGSFIRSKVKRAPRNLDESIAKDGGATQTVTAATRPAHPLARPIAGRSKRRR